MKIELISPTECLAYVNVNGVSMEKYKGKPELKTVTFYSVTDIDQVLDLVFV